MSDPTNPAQPAPDDRSQVPAVQRHRTYAVVQSDDPLFDSAKFEHMARVANALAQSTLLPEGLRKDGDRWLTLPELQANAFVVVGFAQSLRVQVMAVAQSMGMVHGRPVFEGKFIAAVIESNLGVKLQYEWFGQPGTEGYGIKVSTKQDADRGYHPVSGTVKDWRTKKKGGDINDVWIGHKQTLQLAYRGAREWCRLNEPGLILGIYGGDEFDAAGAVHEVAPPPRISAGFAEPIQTQHQEVQTAKVNIAPEPAKETPAPVVQTKQPEEPRTDVLRFMGEAIPITFSPDTNDWASEDGRTFVQDGPLGEWSLVVDGKRRPLVMGGGVLGPDHVGEQKPSQAYEDEDAHRKSDTPADEAEKAATATSVPKDRMDPEEILRPFLHVVSTLKDWQSIRQCLSRFAVMDDWKALGAPERARAKAGVWRHVEGLNWAAKEAGEAFTILPHQDLLAYNCALLACEDVDAINFMWAELSEPKNPAWKSATDKARNQMKAATTARIVELQQKAEA